MPIDAVYTWVNGSDLELVRNLSAIRKELALETNKSRYPAFPLAPFSATGNEGLDVASVSFFSPPFSTPACQYKMCVPAPIVVLRHLSNETLLADVQGRGVKKVFKVNHKHKNELHTSTVLLYSSLEEGNERSECGMSVRLRKTKVVKHAHLLLKKGLQSEYFLHALLINS